MRPFTAHKMLRATLVLLLMVQGHVILAAETPLAPTRLAAVTGPLTLTPDAAALLAVSRSSDTALAAEAIATAQAQLQKARSMTGWNASATASLTKSGPAVSFTLPGEGEGQQVTVSPTTVTNIGLEVAKPLYMGARDRHARSAAWAGIEAAQAGTEASNWQIALAARMATLGLLRTDQLSAVAQGQLTAAAEHLRIAEAMFNAGTTSKFEVVQAQTNVSQARGSMVQARAAIEQQTATLRQIVNIPQDIAVSAEEGVPPEMPAGSLHELIAQAWAERPDMAILAASVRAAEASLRLARAGDRFSVQLVGQADHQTAGALSSSDSWRATVAVVQPLHQGGATEAEIAAARSTLAKANLEYEKRQQEIALQVTQARVAVTEAQELLQVATDAEVEAQERLRIAQIRFSSGVGLGVEVIDAQAALTAAQASSVNARYDLSMAVIQLRAALGRDDLLKE